MGYRFKTKPFAHQLDCFNRSYNKKYFALLMDMGTGKSKVLLDTAAWMFDAGHINAVLILANKGSYTNWISDAIPEHMPDHINRFVFLWKSNLGTVETKHLVNFIGKPAFGLKIFVMNVEALSYERSFSVAMNFVKHHQTLVCVDESTAIKKTSSKRTKAALELAEFAVARRIMTGSLIDNRPLDAYSQFEFLEPGCLGFNSYYSFRSHFAELVNQHMNGRSFKIVKGYKNLEDLKERISTNSFIVKKEDCLDLPPKVYQKYFVELTIEQERAYAELKKKLMTQIDGELVSVKIVLTKLMRLHQLVCGHLTDDLGNIHPVPSNRVEMLLSILDEVSGQCIIWANYKPDIVNISKKLTEEYGADSVVTYYGGTDDEEREKAKETFKKGNDTRGVRFLVGNPQTGAYGLNLTGANTVIYYSNSFDAEKRNQSEDRAHRIGQTEKVTYIDIVAPNTIDEKIIEALRQKKNLSDMVTISNWKEWFV